MTSFSCICYHFQKVYVTFNISVNDPFFLPFGSYFYYFWIVSCTLTIISNSNYRREIIPNIPYHFYPIHKYSDINQTVKQWVYLLTSERKSPTTKLHGFIVVWVFRQIRKIFYYKLSIFMSKISMNKWVWKKLFLHLHVTQKVLQLPVLIFFFSFSSSIFWKEQQKFCLFDWLLLL